MSETVAANPRPGAARNASRVASRATTALIDVVHGGLLMGGLILCLIVASALAGHPRTIEGLRNLRQHLLPAEAATPPAEATAASAATRLRPELKAALDSVARRYRVSASALEPVFLTAQNVGREISLDPLLIVAVIAVESRFNPFSESVMGAQGLMQVIPRFHKDKLAAHDDRLALFDPEINVGIGARILKESIARMGSLSTGLQQFAGALDDPDETYAGKVIAERQRLEAAARRGGSAG